MFVDDQTKESCQKLIFTCWRKMAESFDNTSFINSLLKSHDPEQLLKFLQKWDFKNLDSDDTETDPLVLRGQDTYIYIRKMYI